jgi:hypothetical protein
MQVIIGLPAQHWLKQREKTIFQMKSKSKKKVTNYMLIDPPRFCLRERERERELLEFKPKAQVIIYYIPLEGFARGINGFYIYLLGNDARF